MSVSSALAAYRIGRDAKGFGTLTGSPKAASVVQGAAVRLQPSNVEARMKGWVDRAP